MATKSIKTLVAAINKSLDELETLIKALDPSEDLIAIDTRIKSMTGELTALTEE